MKRFAVLAALLFATSVMGAEPFKPNFYGALGVGIDSSDAFLMPTVGYRFRHHLAVEGSYINVGAVDGFKLALVGETHIKNHPRWHLYGSVGAYFLDCEASERVTTTTTVPSTNRCRPSDIALRTTRSSTVDVNRGGSETVFGVGVGATYALRRDLLVRGGVEFVDGFAACDGMNIVSMSIVKEF